MVRVHEREFALIRQYYLIHANNYQIVVNEVRRRRINEPDLLPGNVVQLWTGDLTEEQLRRIVRDAVKRRIGM